MELASNHIKRSQITLFQDSLFDWYRRNKRPLPWRGGKRHGQRDPYSIFVSEIMLQQTQVDRVIPYYKKWMLRWPTVGHLARARRATIIKAWAGLGYNRRAVYLHTAARQVVSEFGGVFPSVEEALMQLPGVGCYTARAIRAFAYGEDVGVLDTNTKRVLLRVFQGRSRLNPTNEQQLLHFADEVVPHTKGDEWNQAMMDFGALVCTAERPLCSLCPLSARCKWYKDGQPDDEDVRLPRKKKPFTKTDRYFRGRIVDRLRISSISISALYQDFHTTYKFSDKTRFDRLLRDLHQEGLIRISGSSVSLP